MAWEAAQQEGGGGEAWKEWTRGHVWLKREVWGREAPEQGEELGGEGEGVAEDSDFCLFQRF